MTARTELLAALAQELHVTDADVLGTLDVNDAAVVWLALAVLTARLPDEPLVVETSRAAQLDREALLQVLDVADPPAPGARVVVAAGRVVVCLPDDAAFAHGRAPTTRIGALAHDLGRAWEHEHEALLVRWDATAHALVALAASTDDGPTVVVPWQSRVVLPFPSGSRDQVAALRALARLSGNVVSALDAGLSAVTTAEEFRPEQTAATAAMLTVLRHADRLVAVSPAASVEYRGWVQTLAAIGLTGPEIAEAPLAPPLVERGAGDDRDAAPRLEAGVLPLVVVTGCDASPRAQTALLRAVARLWDEGAQFALTMLAEGQEGDPGVRREVDRLQRIDRPVDLVTGAGPDLERTAFGHARLAVDLAPAATAPLRWTSALAVGIPVVVRSAGSGLDARLPEGVVAVDVRDEDTLYRLLRDLTMGGERLRVLTERATRWRAPGRDGFASEVWHALRCDEPPVLPRRALAPATTGGDHHQHDVGNDDVGNNHP